MRRRPFAALVLPAAAVLLGAVLPLLPAAPAQAAVPGELVVNGSFELPQLSAGQISYVTAVPGWTTLAGGAVEVENQVAYNVLPSDGLQDIELAADDPLTLGQDVPTVPGQSYTLSLSLHTRPGYPEESGVTVTAGGQPLLVLADGDLPADVWNRFDRTFTATGPSTQVVIQDTSGGNPGLAAWLDDVSLVAASPYAAAAAATVASNTSWVNALTLPEGTDTPGVLGADGEARWYRFAVVPGSTVQVDLTGLSSDADLTMFRDIGAAFTSLTSSKDLARLGTEFAGDAFAPSVYSPSVYSPSVYSPSVYSPSVYSPSVYSPSVYSPSVYSPSVYSPSVYSPSVYSPSVYSPSVYSPSVYSPDQSFVSAFSGAQSRSLIGVSSTPGTAPESVRSATWSATGSFYVRVQSGDGGAATPFTVRLTTTGGPCTGVTLNTFTDLPAPSVSGLPTTVVLTDTARLGLSGTAKTAYVTSLQRVGTVVDADTLPRTRALNAQADASPDCTYAKNLVAQSLRDVVNSYRALPGSAVRYVVVAGPDPVVPFFRYADSAGIGPEQDYVPPVRAGTGSQASLGGNQVLGQDAYGAVTDLQIKGSVLPVPDLAVGRLVETPAEITGQVDQFLRQSGVLPTPRSSLATGYDFLTSAADAVQSDFRASFGAAAASLITAQGVPTTTTTVKGVPSRSTSWTAADLKNALLGSRHDLVFLAGHFSSSNALAADYSTSISTTDVAAKPGLFTNSLVFSAGCHSGYSLPDGDGIAGLSQTLDWAQEMAQQKALLVAGSGYQYADTDFLAYSAKLYTQFSRELRTGTAGTPVRVGQALVQAKQDYLAGLTSLTGLDSKSLLETTLYGLPMTGIDLPGRVAPVAVGPGLSPAPVAAGTPGAVLGLQTATVSPSTTATLQTRPVVGTDGAPTGATYRWRVGDAGVSTAPAVPALPLESTDVTSDDGTVLRGVGFRSGTYTDTPGTTPLTGAPTTEQNGVHTSFGSPSFFPHRLASANWYGALTGAGDGRTRLLTTPVQHRADPSGTTSTERAYGQIGLQLYYSADVGRYGANTPALAAPPSISQVSGVVGADGTLAVQARITGDPSAGIQQVWTTFTAEDGPLHGSWRSVDLVQSPTDSTLWTGQTALPAGQAAGSVRFLVQAANGVGLVAMDDDVADGYVPQVAGASTAPPAPTTTALRSGAPTSGRYGDTASIPVALAGVPAGSRVQITVGSAYATGVTAADGTATVRLPLRTPVGSYSLLAVYGGSATTAPSSATVAFRVDKAVTALAPSSVSGKIARTGDVRRTFTLSTAGRPLPDKAVLLQFVDSKGRTVLRVTRRTDLLGRVDLGGLTLPAGRLYLGAAFGLDVPGCAADTTYRASVSGMVLDVA